MFTSAIVFAALTGYWTGSVTSPAGALPIGISITASSATIDAAPLGYAEKPLRIAARTESRIALELDADEQLVKAELTGSGDELRGAAKLGNASMPIALHRAEAPSKPYTTEDVSIAAANATLAATLYLPKSSTPVPAVVFVAGLTPRSDAVHFLADAFARRGFAVLTYDKRGLGKSTGDRWAPFDLLADDAAAALRFAASRKEIDANRIGIRGQSQGAWIAPLAALRSPVAFAILTGGGGVTPWESETYAIPARMRAAGYSDADIAAATHYLQKYFDVARRGSGWDELAAMVDVLNARHARWLGEIAPLPRSLERLRQVWAGEFSYDPRPVLKKLTIPVLALQGENDVYSPPASSQHALAENLASPDKTIRLVNNATHDFHVAGAPLPLISDDHLSTLLSWSEAHALAGPADPIVTDHRIVSRAQNVTVDVDPSLQYVGRIGVDIKHKAWATRIVYASADASRRIHRLVVVQFEQMLPENPRGKYDVPKNHPVQLGPFTFDQTAGRGRVGSSTAPESIAMREMLARERLTVADEMAAARFETHTDPSDRAELILFYYEDLAAVNGDFQALAENAKKLFRVAR